LESQVFKIKSAENGATNRNEGVLNSAASPHILLKLARPIGFKSEFKTESVENGATNRNTGVFKVYNLLKLALVFLYSAENGASNRRKVMFSYDIHLNIAHPIVANVCLDFIVS
jgi:hypothetical protein